MKIEKLTNTKIRVIINSSDLEESNLDIHTLLKKETRGKNFFLNILEQAKKEVGFNTDGYKLLIEAFSGTEDNFIFTITKYMAPDQQLNISPQSFMAKRKKPLNPSKQAIYSFNAFDEYCDFCNSLVKNTNFDIKMFSKNISLYLYKEIYYLVVKNINVQYVFTKQFFSLISEFSIPLNYSNVFENKLIEYGKTIMDKDAILLSMQYFM